MPPSQKSINLDRVREWFQQRGWRPHSFQEQAWKSILEGRDGLIHVPTGAGKTLAAFFGALPLIQPGKGLQLIYLSPLRAVARDIEKSLVEATSALDPSIRIESRTGDTSSSVRRRQKRRMPEVLITTIESLSLLLSYPDAEDDFSSLRVAVIDEWHELLSTKRGTQTELALAHLRSFNPSLRTWALSATLSNLDEAALALVGVAHDRNPAIVNATIERPIRVSSLIPQSMESFPWAGHLGMKMLPQLIEWLDPERSTLIFTNTRSQAEKWYAAIADARPEWKEILALHHGSIDRDSRAAIEGGLKSESTRLVVATSSLDLGVDFSPVERVIQIGSPRTVARLIQRAGRAAHRPRATCEILCIPTHAFECLEIAAAREAIERGDIESRSPLDKPLDVLCQHLVTCALGGGFVPDQLYCEVKTTYAFRKLSREEFDWTLQLVESGGECLKAYPDYHRVTREGERCRVVDQRLARMHRMSVGTITADATIQVRFAKGKKLGTIEESFIARLKPGDTFTFSGRTLQFVRIKDSEVIVKRGTGAPSFTPRWSGGRLPLSQNLSSSLRQYLGRIARGAASHVDVEEVRATQHILNLQERISSIPGSDGILAEECQTRNGYHLFFFPFAGRLVHEGLGALTAYRMAQRQPATFSVAVNDYGIALTCPEPFPYRDFCPAQLFAPEKRLEDIAECVNMTELARRQFRDIARVSVMVFPQVPGARKSGRQLQASAGLIYDVFRRYEPENLLVHQSQREVVETRFEGPRLLETMTRLSSEPWTWKRLAHPSPFAFPLVIEELGARLSTESLRKRIERMTKPWLTAHTEKS